MIQLISRLADTQIRSLALVALVLLHTGCSTLPNPAKPNAPHSATLSGLKAPTSSSSRASDAQTLKQKRALTQPDATQTDPLFEQLTELPTEQVASFESETLYDLLIAEVAGKRGRLDIALGNYMKQAHHTQDIHIAERYAAIAAYMGADQATEDAGKLWLSLSPEDSRAHSFMLNHYIRNQQPALIEPHARKVLRDAPDQFEYELVVAKSRTYPADQKEILFNELQRLSLEFGRSPVLWFLMASLKQQQEAFETALDFVETGLDVDDAFLPNNLLKVDLLSRTGEEEKAVNLLKKIAKKNPNNKKLGLVYARTLIRNKDYRAAQNEFEKLVDRFPSDSELLMTLAILSVENDQYAEAKRYLETLVDQGQRTDDAYTYLGQISENEDDLDAAIRYYSKVKTPPLYTRAQMQISSIYAQRQEYALAIKQLSTARKIDEKHRDEYLLRESDLIKKSQSEAAAFAFLSRALQESPDSISLLYARAMIADKLDRIDLLEKDLRKILEISPDNSVALNALGYSLANRDMKLEESYALIKKAHALKPNDPAIIDSLGWVYYKLGELDKALAWLGKANSLLQDPEIMAHYIEALWVDNQHKKAREIYRAAIIKYPDHELLLELDQRFEINNNLKLN